MKYICKFCKAEVESEYTPLFCDQCAGQNSMTLKNEETEVEKTKIAKILYETTTGYAVQFHDETYGVLNRGEKDYSSLIGQEIMCTIVGKDSSGYPLVVLIDENSSLINVSSNNTTAHEVSIQTQSNENTSVEVREEEDNDYHFDETGAEWIKWWGSSIDNINGVSHRSAVMAMAGLRNFINAYVKHRNDLIKVSA